MAVQRSHYDNQNSANPNAALVHNSYGEHVGKYGTHANHVRDGIGPATWSTAPYVPPKPKGIVVLEPDVKTCSIEGCRGHATKRWPGLCAGHGAKADRDSGDAGRTA